MAHIVCFTGAVCSLYSYYVEIMFLFEIVLSITGRLSYLLLKEVSRVYAARCSVKLMCVVVYMVLYSAAISRSC